jgi:hypothetical protein
MNIVRLLPAGTATDAVIANRFAVLGWHPRPRLPAPSSQPSHDRLLGAWDGPSGASAELSDDGLLRVLEVRGADETTLAALRRLPHHGTAEILARLGSTDARELAAAVRGAAALGDPALAPALAALRRHPDDAVRAEARAALQAMVPDLIEIGMAQLRASAASGSGNPLWSPSIPLRLRRQLVRWLVRAGAPDGLDATLRAALVDPDWEVRAGAAFAAVRHRRVELLPLLRGWSPATSGRSGPARPDRPVLKALADVATEELAACARNAQAAHRPRPPAWQHLNDCVLGCAVTRDVAWRLARSLTEPIPELDAAILDVPGWCHVPAVEHWIGRDDALRAVQGPAAWVAESVLAGASGPLLCEFAEAGARAAAAGGRMPTADEWECAMRGTDARCFASGAGIDEDRDSAASPWGCRDLGVAFEWVVGRDGPELRGGVRPAPCSHGRAPQPGGVAAVRPIRATPPD